MDTEISVQHRPSDDDVRREISRVLWDAKKFAIAFASDVRPQQRIEWFELVNQVYRDIGGDHVAMIENRCDPNMYLICPKDDPANNLIY